MHDVNADINSSSGLRRPGSELSSAVDPERFQSPKEMSKNRPRSCPIFDHSWSLSNLPAYPPWVRDSGQSPMFTVQISRTLCRTAGMVMTSFQLS